MARSQAAPPALPRAVRNSARHARPWHDAGHSAQPDCRRSSGSSATTCSPIRSAATRSARSNTCFGDLKKGDRRRHGRLGGVDACARPSRRTAGASARHVHIGRWKQEMNPAAQRVSPAESRVARSRGAGVFECLRRIRVGLAATRARRAMDRGGRQHAARCSWPRERGTRARGADRLGVSCPNRGSVVVPLGTGGTAAGLALAFAIARRPITRGRRARRAANRRASVARRALAHRTAQLIERTTRDETAARHP